MKIETLVGIGVVMMLLPGCAEQSSDEPSAPGAHNQEDDRVPPMDERKQHADLTDSSNNELDQGVISDFVLSNCSGFLGEVTWLAPVGFPHQPPEGWESRAGGQAEMFLVAANCSRLSSSNGLVLQNVSWGIELQSNITSNGKEDWQGTYEGLYSPVNTFWSAAPNIEDWVEGETIQLQSVDVTAPRDAYEARGTMKADGATWSVESQAFLPSSEPGQVEPGIYRVVTNGPEDEFYEMREDLRSSGFAASCVATFEGTMGGAELPQNDTGKVVFDICLYFEESTFSFTKGGSS